MRLWTCARPFTPRIPTCRRSGARVLGLYLCVRLTLTYLRHNLSQGLVAEVYGVSQATASRVVTAYTPLIARALEVSVPTVEDLDPTVQLIVDGTLLQCWSWADHPELYSGKHQTTGVNVQVACTLSGTLAWVSDLTRDSLVGFRWLGVSFRWYCCVGGLVVGH